MYLCYPNFPGNLMCARLQTRLALSGVSDLSLPVPETPSGVASIPQAKPLTRGLRGLASQEG